MPRFSLVYPTRHRPQFVRQALRVLETQGHDDFEVIVCDNYIDPSLSCEAICRESKLTNIRYVRPPEPIGMVANWNHALTAVTGEYVSFFTDKMFLLPKALTRIERVIERAGAPDIVNWASDTFSPATFNDYFGAGRYFGMPSDVRAGSHEAFGPRDELDCKGRARISRSAQSPSHYARGKILFGAFHRDLIERIRARYGALFQGINPDYTSMILGLSEAAQAVEVASSCVVSVSTDISNGQLIDTHDAMALAFLRSLDDPDELIANLMVPGLYSAVSNLVAHDYLTLKHKYDLPFEFNESNWLAYCMTEVERAGRVWSSAAVQSEQTRLLAERLAKLGPEAARRVREKAFETRSDDVSTPPRFVLPFDSLDAALAWRASPFASLQLARNALWTAFERDVLGHRWVQRSVMREDWFGRSYARHLYRRLKERMK